MKGRRRALIAGVVVLAVGGLVVVKRMNPKYKPPQLLRHLASDDTDGGGYETSLAIPTKRDGTFELVYFRYRGLVDPELEARQPPYMLLRVDPIAGEVLEERAVTPAELGHDAPPHEYLPPGERESKRANIPGWDRINVISRDVWRAYATQCTPGDAIDIAREYRDILFEVGKELKPYYQFLLRDFEEWLG